MPSLPQLISFHGCDQPGATPAPATAADFGLDAAGLRPAARPRGLYLHVPFCFHKCHYCDFYSVVDARGRQPAFAARLASESRAAAAWLNRPLETIFVGGGTPTLMEPQLWREVLAALRELPRAPDCEFTVEANPETVTAELLEVLAAGGVNRLSLGAQSFDRRHLATLERRHDPASVARSTALARAAGIDNLNLDLIFAIPGQSLAGWQADLDAALDLGPAHLSCYALTYEPGTPLTARLERGLVERADESLEAAMYEAAASRLGGAGFEHYEISNWARPGRRCRHNLLYWHNASWWPLGPGAAGHVDGLRWRNVPRLSRYLAAGPLPPVTDVERLDTDGRVGETLMLRLRLVEGMDEGELKELLERGRRGPQRAEVLQHYTREGLVTREGGRLRLTRRGLLLADGVLADLL